MDSRRWNVTSQGETWVQCFYISSTPLWIWISLIHLSRKIGLPILKKAHPPKVVALVRLFQIPLSAHPKLARTTVVCYASPSYITHSSAWCPMTLCLLVSCLQWTSREYLTFHIPGPHQEPNLIHSQSFLCTVEAPKSRIQPRYGDFF